jgi:hypothetical protein
MAQYSPSQVFDSYWVYALEDNRAATFPNLDGKWMMFFPMSEMDARWTEACQLYRSGRLFGVNSMKASTAKQNPMPERLHGPNEGIIIFYCGPCEDQANVMAYGRNILNNMHYPRETFYFKSDKPHLIDWRKQYKHMYYINTLQHYSGSYGVPNNFFPTNLNQNIFVNNFGIPGFPVNLPAPVINSHAYFNELGFNNLGNPLLINQFSPKLFL